MFISMIYILILCGLYIIGNCEWDLVYLFLGLFAMMFLQVLYFKKLNK